MKGLLIYAAHKYQEFYPYLKGVHIMIYGWIPGRDEEGWKYPTCHLMEGNTDVK